MNSRKFDSGGFTLVEILLVLGMLGVVVTALFSLYESSRRSADTQDKIVEVQQNVRVAMDSITKDIRNAGMLLPLSDNLNTPAAQNLENSPIGSAGPSRIVINTTCMDEIAQVMQNLNLVGAASYVDLTISSTVYPTIGKRVRVIRPETLSEVTGTSGTLYTVTSRPSPTVVRLTYVSGNSIDKDFHKGDMICSVSGAQTSGQQNIPDHIIYSLSSGTLIRTVSGPSGDVSNAVASNISNLSFNYVMDGPESRVVTSIPSSLYFPLASDVLKVKAVGVMVTGQTTTIDPTIGTRSRVMTSIIRLRNK